MSLSDAASAATSSARVRTGGTGSIGSTTATTKTKPNVKILVFSDDHFMTYGFLSEVAGMAQQDQNNYPDPPPTNPRHVDTRPYREYCVNFQVVMDPSTSGLPTPYGLGTIREQEGSMVSNVRFADYKSWLERPSDLDEFSFYAGARAAFIIVDDRKSLRQWRSFVACMVGEVRERSNITPIFVISVAPHEQYWKIKAQRDAELEQELAYLIKDKLTTVRLASFCGGTGCDGIFCDLFEVLTKKTVLSIEEVPDEEAGIYRHVGMPIPAWRHYLTEVPTNLRPTHHSPKELLVRHFALWLSVDASESYKAAIGTKMDHPSKIAHLFYGTVQKIMDSLLEDFNRSASFTFTYDRKNKNDRLTHFTRTYTFPEIFNCSTLTSLHQVEDHFMKLYHRENLFAQTDPQVVDVRSLNDDATGFHWIQTMKLKAESHESSESDATPSAKIFIDASTSIEIDRSGIPTPIQPSLESAFSLSRVFGTMSEAKQIRNAHSKMSFAKEVDIFREWLHILPPQFRPKRNKDFLLNALVTRVFYRFCMEFGLCRGRDLKCHHQLLQLFQNAVRKLLFSLREDLTKPFAVAFFYETCHDKFFGMRIDFPGCFADAFSSEEPSWDVLEAWHYKMVQDAGFFIDEDDDDCHMTSSEVLDKDDGVEWPHELMFTGGADCNVSAHAEIAHVTSHDGRTDSEAKEDAATEGQFEDSPVSPASKRRRSGDIEASTETDNASSEERIARSPNSSESFAAVDIVRQPRPSSGSEGFPSHLGSPDSSTSTRGGRDSGSQGFQSQLEIQDISSSTRRDRDSLDSFISGQGNNGVLLARDSPDPQSQTGRASDDSAWEFELDSTNDDENDDEIGRVSSRRPSDRRSSRRISGRVKLDVASLNDQPPNATSKGDYVGGACIPELYKEKTLDYIIRVKDILIAHYNNDIHAVPFSSWRAAFGVHVHDDVAERSKAFVKGSIKEIIQLIGHIEKDCDEQRMELVKYLYRLKGSNLFFAKKNSKVVSVPSSNRMSKELAAITVSMYFQCPGFAIKTIEKTNGADTGYRCDRERSLKDPWVEETLEPCPAMLTDEVAELMYGKELMDLPQIRKRSRCTPEQQQQADELLDTGLKNAVNRRKGKDDGEGKDDGDGNDTGGVGKNDGD